MALDGRSIAFFDVPDAQIQVARASGEDEVDDHENLVGESDYGPLVSLARG